MLTQIEIGNIPKPKKDLSEQKLIRINYLSSIKHVSPVDAIIFDSTIQVVVALLYSYNNPGQPVCISLPKGLTSIEILNTPLVQILPSVFKTYRFIINRNNIAGLFVKDLLDETKEAFRTLKENNKIDPCLNRLLRGYYVEDFTPINVVAFEVSNSDVETIYEKVPLVLSNKFFLYLLTESIRQNGFFCIPIPAWSKKEIEKEHYFIDLTKLFKKVCVIGMGYKWKSIQLLVSEPFEEIVHCIVDHKSSCN